MPSLITAYSTEIDAERTDTLESDYYSQFIDKKTLEHEQELFTRKWFDYRHMTVLQATGVYIEAYNKVYRRIYAREYDRERAEHIKPINFEGILGDLKRNGLPKAKRRFVGCWRGRQIADWLCMPYEIYLDLAFTYRMRWWQQNTMPQPTQLYGEAIVEKIVERWEELKLSNIYTAEHPAYLNQNYQDIAHQNDYHEWLFTQANSRQNVPEFLAQFVKDDHLPLEKVRSRVSQEVYEKVEYYLQ